MVWNAKKSEYVCVCVCVRGCVCGCRGSKKECVCVCGGGLLPGLGSGMRDWTRGGKLQNASSFWALEVYDVNGYIYFSFAHLIIFLYLEQIIALL